MNSFVKWRERAAPEVEKPAAGMHKGKEWPGPGWRRRSPEL